MASKFKGPKTFTKGRQAVSTPSKAQKFSSDLGFSDSDSNASDSGSDSESNHDSASDNEEGGISFLEYLTLQKSLRKVTEQKLEITETLKSTKENLRKTERALDRATSMNHTQVAILKSAQKNQIDDKEQLVDSLRLSIEELEEKSNSPTGLSQMVDQISSLSNEKREYYESWQTNEALYKQAQQDLEETEKEYSEKVAELQAEKAALQNQIDPVKAAKQAGKPSDLDNPIIDELRAENSELRSKLRDAEASGGSGGSGGEVAATGISTQAAGEIKGLESKLKSKTAEVKDLNAKLAKLQAAAASGADQEQAVVADMSAEIAKLKELKASLETKSEELATKFSEESAAHKQVKEELTALKAGLESASKASADSKKSIESQLQQATQDLAKEKASSKATQSAHEQTKSDLQAVRAELSKAKEGVTKSQAANEKAIKAEKDRAVAVLQKAKADAAAEVAEVKQRAKDNMKDMKEKLANFSTIVGPMAAAVKSLSSNYKKLRKQTRDLQGEIQPAVKQCKRDLLRTLAEVDKNYKEMLRKYRKEMQLRKKLHNEIVDLKGAIRVFGRVRPIISEDGKSTKVVVKFDQDDDQKLVVKAKQKDMPFALDHIFNMESQQNDVFEACKDLITSVTDGYNVCIFAYGQTGSGKTFTMDGTDEHPGLNRRALNELFDVVAERKADWSYEIEVSVLEIYNEQLRDLLSDKPKKLDIKHGKSGPNVPGLTRQPVRNADEVRARFDQAKSIRATSSTKMNDLSSRSHALLVVYVIGTNLSTGVQTTGKLNLIDLAGSERVSKSGAVDDEKRFKEATNINKSLSALGNVINALGAKQKHVPYRDSKLTHLLQDSLGGHAKTLMVVQLSPVEKNCSETVCSLNFAQRVRAVELGGAKKNKDSSDVAQLKKRIKELEGR